MSLVSNSRFRHALAVSALLLAAPAVRAEVVTHRFTGQITTVFDTLPQVPFTAFALTFNGGAKAVLNNPPTCGEKVLAATLTPWSGTAARSATASFTIDQVQERLEAAISSGH